MIFQELEIKCFLGQIEVLPVFMFIIPIFQTSPFAPFGLWVIDQAVHFTMTHFIIMQDNELYLQHMPAALLQQMYDASIFNIGLLIRALRHCYFDPTPDSKRKTWWMMLKLDEYLKLQGTKDGKKKPLSFLFVSIFSD